MPSRTIREVVAAALPEHPAPELVRLEGRWRATPRGELDRVSLQLAAALVAYGLEPGSRVATLTADGSEALLGFLAVLRASGTLVPLHPSMPDERILETLLSASVRQVLVSDDEQLERLLRIRPELPELDLILLFRETGENRAAALTVRGACAAGAEALAGDSTLLSREAPGDEQTAAVRLEAHGRETVLSRGNVLAASESAGAALAIERGEVVLSALESSDAAQTALALACLARGATIAHVSRSGELGEAMLALRPHVVVMPRRLCASFREIVDSAARAGTWMGKRLLGFALAQGGRRAAADLAAGRFPAARTWGWRAAEALVIRRIRRATGGRLTRLISLGEPVAAADRDYFLALGIPFLEGYAVPEAGGLVAVNRRDALRPGTVGRLVPGLAARSGQGGALELRGAMVSGEGWRTVPVRGRLDGDGYLAEAPGGGFRSAQGELPA